MTAQTPDFAAIITDAAQHADYSELAGEVLAAPIHELCPDCKGTGSLSHYDHIGTCPHDDAPTIGQALNEWAAHKEFRDEWEIWGSGGSTDSYTVQYRRRK